ncbi:MAG: ferrous iron transport protein B [Coriobacteriaceae bacterium]|nr:ferrous iron transport protein B [Coriobacteriaceae bacterium]
MTEQNEEVTIYEVPELKTLKPGDHIVALSGQQNTGKTTTFNALTGLNQHTGNWPGLTVDTAEGRYKYNDQGFVMVDLPGTYSLLTATSEEDIAASFVISGMADCVCVVCDACSLERNLVLPLQILELTDKVILVVNLIDEAQKRDITVDFEELSQLLGVPVVGIAAGPHWGLDELKQTIDDVADGRIECHPNRRICDGTESGIERIHKLRGDSPEDSDATAELLVHRAEEIASRVVERGKETGTVRRQRVLDQIFMGPLGIPASLLLLALVFWITIEGANYPSDALQMFFDWATEMLTRGAIFIGMPDFLQGFLIDGVFVVAGKVISVMLPPMAIFFPIFTLLEDFGYLPRVAFRLDHTFQRCGACGKQSLTMCMGFGCNAAGVVGCRIIDSPREKLIAMLTNVLVPCNGRFPTLIMMITIFFSGTGMFSSLISALILVAFVVIGILATFLMSKILNATILRGQPSSFVLEMPPYRKPQVIQVIVRSVIDRTLKVLMRALVCAAPAGAIIWILGNVMVGDASILMHFVDVMNPIGIFLGLDGVILVAFILGLPANETVIPVAIMILMASGTIVNTDDTALIGDLLIGAGWTWKTALCTMVFVLFHWPCATTLLSIRRESGSWKWVGWALLLPTALGVVTCAVLHILLSFIPPFI